MSTRAIDKRMEEKGRKEGKKRVNMEKKRNRRGKRRRLYFF